MGYAPASPAYDSLLKSLDPDQRQIVLTWSPGTNLQVLAAAGSGKTRTVVALVARALVEGLVPPQQIVVTTFTRKAADELTARLKSVLPEPLVESLRVGTYHGLAAKYFMRSAQRPDFTRCLDGKGRAAGLQDATGLWMDVLGYRVIRNTSLKGLNIKAAYAGDYALAVECIRAQGCKPGTPEAVKAAKAAGLAKLPEAWALYEEAKGVLRAWDFADLLHTWMLRAESGHDSAQLVVVDEAQDNQIVQMRIARALARNAGGAVLYVGDARQAIYGWRGAAPEQFAAATQDFGAVRAEIRSNYRSAEQIIRVANAVADGQPWSIGEPSRVGRPDKTGSVEVYGGIDILDEGAQAADRIEASVGCGRTYGDHAILVRTNAAAAAFETELLVRGIPVAVQGSSSFFARRAVQDAMAYLQLAEAPKEAALRRVVGAVPAHLDARYIGEAFVNGLPETAYMTPAALIEAIKRSGSTLSAAGSRRGAASLAELLTTLSQAPWHTRLQALAAFYTPPTRELTEEGMPLDPSADSDEVLVQTLTTIAERYESATQLHAFGQACQGHVKVVDASGDRLRDRVTISTIHRAKGLEWPVVIVSATQNVFPHVRNEGNDAEERRLFYVAVTRAEERLILSYAHTNTRGHVAGPSPYIALARAALGQGPELPPAPPRGGGRPAGESQAPEQPAYASVEAYVAAKTAERTAVTTPSLAAEAEKARKALDPAVAAAIEAKAERVSPNGRAVVVRRADFRQLLEGAGFIEDAQQGQRVWTLCLGDDVEVCVWSSVPTSSEEARGVGEDSIRITCMYTGGTGAPRPLLKRPPYTPRTAGWATGLMGKLVQTLQRFETTTRCRACGGACFTQDGPTGSFEACLQWCKRK